MQNQKHTDKSLLLQGLKKMALALPLLFLAPYLITLGFLNKKTFMLYVFLGLGIAIAALAGYLAVTGLKKIMNSLFQK